MESSPFILGLLSENEVSLKGQVVLWDDSTIWSSTWKAINSKASVSHPIINKVDDILLSKAGEIDLPELVRTDWQIMKLYRLMEFAELGTNGVATDSSLHELGFKIEAQAIKCLHETNTEFSGSTGIELAQFTLQSIFEEFGEKFQSASDTDKERIANEVLKSIQELPLETQKELLEQLGVDALTENVVKNLISAGAFTTGLSAIVSVAGFSAYTALTSAMAALAGTIGLTLPFSAYIGATSALAFVTNPVLLAAGGLGLGAWFTKSSNRKIRSTLFPTLVAFSIINQSDQCVKIGDFLNQDRRRQREFLTASSDKKGIYRSAFPSMPDSNDL
jgi:hypothetical protein